MATDHEKFSATGPSYFDVQQAVEHVRDRYGVGIDFTIVPPLYIKATGERQSWQVVARVWRLSDSRETTIGDRQAFGRNAAWATMPAAMHAAVLAVADKLYRIEMGASEQMTF